MKAAVIIFPGSNCDIDMIHVLQDVLHCDVTQVWHQESSLEGFDFVALPGGFSYGDYLRCGAIARFSPIMEAVVKHAKSGKLVLGVCNGFQILTETGLLPGALLRNNNLQFRCQDVHLRVENNQTVFSSLYKPQQIIRIPIAHADGNYFADHDTLDLLEKENRIVFRYVSNNGERTPEANPNGALNDIAGIINEKGNVLGMMPHPERLAEEILGGSDGRWLFESVLKSWREKVAN